jgi:tetratricopeptide (TPR) repeat protein
MNVNISFPFSLKQRPLSVLFLLLLSLVISNGCVVKDMGNVVKHNVTGDYFLSTEKYSRGAENFQQEVAKNPDSVLANYYYGRFLLGTKQYKEALPYLQKATTLKPDNPDYRFWLGVVYGSLGKKSSERKSYLAALSLKEDHLQSLIYLGHNRLEAKKYKAALINYTKALKLWPASPSSLYNRALILTKLGRKPESLDGWLDYLSYYPSGAMARQAVTRLNSLNDFSFRNYTLRSRTVTVEKIYFDPLTVEIAQSSYGSIELIGAIFKNMKKGRLQLIVYQLNNMDLARQKAIKIKTFLLKNYPKINKKDIGISWFDSPEIIKIRGKKKKIEESVSFFIST